MNHAEMVNLIRKGVEGASGVWADVGAGTGNFTRALCDLLPSTTQIYAIDRDAWALERFRQSWSHTATLHTLNSDFTRSLDLPPLDGLLMVNALHFVAHQHQTLKLLLHHLHPGGRFLLVEYDVSKPLAHIPYPIARTYFPTLMQTAGLCDAAIVGERRSPSTGMTMYTGLGFKPSA